MTQLSVFWVMALLPIESAGLGATMNTSATVIGQIMCMKNRNGQLIHSVASLSFKALNMTQIIYF